MATLNLPGREDKAPTPGTRLPLEILQHHVEELEDIPTLPDAALEALAVVRDPDCSLRALAGVVEKDPALAAGLLKMANSPLYRTGRSVGTLDQALLRLGLRESQNLILAVSMHSLFRNGALAPGQRVACERLWRHSLVTATLCRYLNHMLELGFTGEEFAGGISHDIGRILLILVAFEAFQRADPLDFAEGPDALTRSRRSWGPTTVPSGPGSPPRTAFRRS